MELEILRNERTGKPLLQINDARIVFRNFSGRADKYNREGDRNFALLIPNEEIADALVDAGFNVKRKPPRDEDDNDFIYLPIKVAFNDRGPKVYLQATRRTLLNEDTIGCLDNIDIDHVDMDIRAYDWEVNGNTGRTAYLQGGCVYQIPDRFAPDDLDY